MSLPSQENLCEDFFELIWKISIKFIHSFPVLRAVVLKITKIIGANLESRQLLSWHQKTIMVIHLMALVTQINALIDVWPNPAEICNSILAYFLVIQTVIRGINRFTNNDEKIVSEIEEIIDKFYQKNEKNGKFHGILYSHVKTFKPILLALLAVYFSAFHMTIPIGWIMTWISGEAKILIPIKFLFINLNTTFGYLFVQVFITLVSTSIFAVIAGDVYNFYLTLQTVLMVKILNCRVDELGEDLIKVREMEEKVEKMKTENLVAIKSNGFLNFRDDILNRRKSKTNYLLKELENLRNYVDRQLKNIIEEHNNYSDYVLRVMKYREMISFTTLYVNFIGIGLSVVAIKSSSASFAVSALILFILQVFVQCFEGTLVSIQNDKVLEKLHEFPWYELLNSQKKIFLQFLCICQNCCSFKLPIFGDVDMELFTDIMHASYSFLVYVIQFVNIK